MWQLKCTLAVQKLQFIYLVVKRLKKNVYNLCRKLSILTHYHTMSQFDASKTYSCGKHCEKRRNCLLQAISPFPIMFSTLYGTYFPF